MQKLSTRRVVRNRIREGGQLTIGLDLGDRWSYYCVLDELGKIVLEEKLPTTPEAMKRIFEKQPREPDRPGDRHTFSLGQPAVNGVGARSNRGPCAEGAVNYQEQSKR